MTITASKSFHDLDSFEGEGEEGFWVGVDRLGGGVPPLILVGVGDLILFRFRAPEGHGVDAQDNTYLCTGRREFALRLGAVLEGVPQQIGGTPHPIRRRINGVRHWWYRRFR